MRDRTVERYGLTFAALAGRNDRRAKTAWTVAHVRARDRRGAQQPRAAGPERSGAPDSPVFGA
jgi:hypothetical protein